MAFMVYPVCETQPACADYAVRINGRPVETNTARVSAVPLNRRWPGHQRPTEQTELVQFLSMAADDEPLEVEITPKMHFERVTVRPLSLGLQPTIEKGVIRFTLKKAAAEPVYVTVEPYGRRRALHLFVDSMPEYAVDFSDERVLYFGPGEHDVGLLVLESGQTLFLDAGAVVYACVQARDAENIRILGRGILDNSRNREKIRYECHAEGNFAAIDNAERRHTIQLEYCSGVEIDGITIRDSLVYNIRPIGCENLHIANVKIIGCWRYNSDGIDMHNCTDVCIEDCFLRTFDDSICVKGFDCYYEGDVEAAVQAAMTRNGKDYSVFRRVEVRGCTIWNDWGKCLEIGAETRAEEICAVRFADCDVIHVNGPVLDCCNVDYADVHDVVYEGIRVEFDEVIPPPIVQERGGETYPEYAGDYAPELVQVAVLFHPEYSAGGRRRGRNRRMVFRNCSLVGRQPPRFRFLGFDEAHLTEEITVENLLWNGKLVESLAAEQWVQNEFTAKVRYVAGNSEKA